MSRLTLPEITEETQAEGFQYSYEVDEPAKAGEGKVIKSMFKNGLGSGSSRQQRLHSNFEFFYISLLNYKLTR